jgi:hypothetical protein
MARLDHLGKVEPHQLGKVSRFPEEQLRNPGHARRADLLPPAEHQHAQQLEGAARKLRDKAFHLRDR